MSIDTINIESNALQITNHSLAGLWTYSTQQNLNPYTIISVKNQWLLRSLVCGRNYCQQFAKWLYVEPRPNDLQFYPQNPPNLTRQIPSISRGQLTQRPITHQLLNMSRTTDYRALSLQWDICSTTPLYMLQEIQIKKGCVAGELFTLSLFHCANKATFNQRESQ